MRVGVIDYGTGNLGSVMRALEELRVTPVLVDRPEEIKNADGLILPGVGNFTDCKGMLDEGGWTESLNSEVQDKGKPLLGICLGMQLLADLGAEGAVSGNFTRGLGYIPGKVRHFREAECSLRIPHVGWNSIVLTANAGLLFKGIPNGTDYYFVHSYIFEPEFQEHILAMSEYEVLFAAAVCKNNVWGTQFHPEKSSRAGFQILKNFIDRLLC